MKINLVDKCKANHTVTVPREYLEQLEASYKENMEKHYNMRADIKNVRHSSPVHPLGYEDEPILFITDNELPTFFRVVVVDEDGRELQAFRRI